MKIGDVVKFIGSAENDIYHGHCVGKTGVVRQLYPFIAVDFDGDGKARAVNAEFVGEVAGKREGC